MRITIFILILLFSFSSKAQLLEKCKNSFDSYSMEVCLKNLKYKLQNYKLNLPILDINGKPYNNKDIFVKICKKYYSEIIHTDEIGSIRIYLTEKMISECPSIVSINIKTEFGICSLGKPAKANWNSLKIQNRLYLECSE